MYPGARGLGNGFVDAMGNLLLCGGIGYSSATDAVGYVNDLWVFDVAQRQWAWICGNSSVNGDPVYEFQYESNPYVAPGARYGSALWNTSGNDPIIFGGYGSYLSTNGFLNDGFVLDVSVTASTPTPTPTPTHRPTPTPTPTPTPNRTPTPT